MSFGLIALGAVFLLLAAVIVRFRVSWTAYQLRIPAVSLWGRAPRQQRQRKAERTVACHIIATAAVGVGLLTYGLLAGGDASEIGRDVLWAAIVVAGAAFVVGS